MGLRFFVTGTDTAVGKSEVAQALLSLMVRRGEQPFALKPLESGGVEDARALRTAAGAWQALETVCLYRWKAPLAPGIAARLEGRRPSWRRLGRALVGFEGRSGVVEGAGGLFVPIDDRHDVIDLVRLYGLPVVVVARAGLGTINHTVMTLRALADVRARVAGVVLVRSSPVKDPSIPFNQPELQRRFPHLPVLGPVPFVAQHARRRRVLMDALAPLIVSEDLTSRARPGQKTRAKRRHKKS